MATNNTDTDPTPTDLSNEPQKGSQEPTKAPEQGKAPETFDRAYVEALRAEAAEHRTRAKRAEEAEEKLRSLAIERAVAGILADSTDLLWDQEYADDDGWPDAVKITAAAEALVDRKPHLGRPSGDVGQGRHSEQDQTVSLSSLLRAGA